MFDFAMSNSNHRSAVMYGKATDELPAANQTDRPLMTAVTHDVHAQCLQLLYWMVPLDFKRLPYNWGPHKAQSIKKCLQLLSA